MRVSLSLREKGIQVVGSFHCPARKASATLDFVVDTGSARSFLAWEDALSAKIDAENLPSHPRQILGFGGTAQAREVRDVCFIYLRSDDSKLEEVEMPDGILVYKPPPKKAKHWVPGPAVSLLGRDFLTRSKYVLHADLARNVIYFER